jgi:hypothetical protein
MIAKEEEYSLGFSDTTSDIPEPLRAVMSDNSKALKELNATKKAVDLYS